MTTTISTYDLNLGSSFSINGVTFSTSTVLTPNAKTGIRVGFFSNNPTTSFSGNETRDIGDITCSSTGGSGIALIAIKSDIYATVNFTNSNSANNVAVTVVPGGQYISARLDTGGSLPFSFSIPTSGNLQSINIVKQTNKQQGFVDIEIYHNVPES